MTTKKSVKEYWGMTCPACGRDDDILISAIHQVRLTEDGTEDLETDDEFDDGLAHSSGILPELLPPGSS